MSATPSDENQETRGRRSGTTARRWIAAGIILAIVACIGYVTWELGGPFRISSVSVAQMRNEGVVDGFIIIAGGKGNPPFRAEATINSVVLVDSESDPHFRINVTLWDRQERELKVGYVLGEAADPAIKLPDRKTQIESQLARTRRAGSVNVQIDYHDESWLSRKLGNKYEPLSGGTKSVPVSIVKQ